MYIIKFGDKLKVDFNTNNLTWFDFFIKHYFPNYKGQYMSNILSLFVS